LRAVSNTNSSVLAVQNVARFLRFAVYHRLPGAVSVVRRMLDSTNSEVARIGTHLAVLFVLQHPMSANPFSRPAAVEFLGKPGFQWLQIKFRLAVAWGIVRRVDQERPINDMTKYASVGANEYEREELALYRCGIRLLCGSDQQRRSVAEVAAGLGGDPRFARYCVAIVRQLVNDKSKEVRREALQVFRTDKFLDQESSADLMRHAVESCAFRDDPTPLLWALKEQLSSVAVHADVVLAVCDAFAGDLARDARDVETAIAGDVEVVSELLLRLYGEANDLSASDLRAACLDRFDRLLRAQAYGVDDSLRQIDS
jgi:hypothetical protein